MSHPDTLLMFSGGLDSTFCLWQRVQRGERTHVHHVVLKDWEDRQEVEAKAVLGILFWLDEHYGPGKIKYTESRVDFGELWIPPNYFMWAYWIGAISAQSAGLNYRTIIHPLNADDPPDAAHRSDLAYLNVIELMTGRKPNLEHPIKHMTKRDIVREMPPDLLSLCWWCRWPQDGKPCHCCYTCQLVDAAMERTDDRE